jgi:hypothetical protein
MHESLNDINALNWSSIFTALAEGHTSPINYIINGHEYTIGYYLTDEVYPN